MWSIHRGQKSKHITPTPKRPPLGTPPAAARQLHAQRSGFTVGAIIDRPLATSPILCTYHDGQLAPMGMIWLLH